MNKHVFCLLFITFLIAASAQNQNSKWYFGHHAALDFSNNPPSPIIGSAMDEGSGVASIADANGNLLFYTNGDTIWNQQNNMLANGDGLTGNHNNMQAVLIVPKPGSTNLYFVFTQPSNPLSATITAGLCYSIVDMNLASGNGSVTLKNQLITYNHSHMLSGVKHCNKTDYWIIHHEKISHIFHTYLLSASGLSNNPITSVINATLNSGNYYSWLKITPNAKKLVFPASGGLELLDFNNATGVISNPQLINGPNGYPEFSSDGTKLYSLVPSNTTGSVGVIYSHVIKQWNLCAGSIAAINASINQFSLNSLSASSGMLLGYPKGMQLAPNGKIYFVRSFGSNLGVINNPNSNLINTNILEFGQSISPNTGGGELPNFIASNMVQEFINYSFSSCLTASFSPPSAANNALLSCQAANNGFSGIVWTFGDPASGPANTSSLTSPSHNFSNYGTYSLQAIIYYSTCAPDTIRQTINIVSLSPTITVATSSINCLGISNATAFVNGGSSNYSYVWLPSAQTGSIANGLLAGNYSISVIDNFYNCTHVYTTTINASVPPSNFICSVQNINYCSSSSATANVTGGSGNYTFFWSPGNMTGASVNNLTPGIYTVTISDVIYNCTITNTVQVNTLPTPNLTISPNSTVCAKQSLTISVIGADTYTWSNGAVLSTIVVTPNVSTIYSVTGTYTSSSCSIIKTVSITVRPCTSINNSSAEQFNFNIYPNPSDGVFMIESDAPIFIIKVYNQLGMLVYQGLTENGKHNINLSNQANGIYFVEVQNKNNLKTQKLIKW